MLYHSQIDIRGGIFIHTFDRFHSDATFGGPLIANASLVKWVGVNSQVHPCASRRGWVNGSFFRLET